MDPAEDARLHAVVSAQAPEQPDHTDRRATASVDHPEATACETDRASPGRIVMAAAQVVMALDRTPCAADRVDLAAAQDRLQIEGFRGKGLMECAEDRMECAEDRMECAEDRAASVVSPVARSADRISPAGLSVHVWTVVRTTEWLAARVTVAMGQDATARLETAWRVMVLATVACPTSSRAWSKSNAASTRSFARSVTSVVDRHRDSVAPSEPELDP